VGVPTGPFAGFVIGVFTPGLFGGFVFFAFGGLVVALPGCDGAVWPVPPVAPVACANITGRQANPKASMHAERFMK
jgi:hypothetical protein